MRHADTCDSKTKDDTGRKNPKVDFVNFPTKPDKYDSTRYRANGIQKPEVAMAEIKGGTDFPTRKRDKKRLPK